jgi:prepilin-type N-terminal cleavage/methylation domain-containing protein
VLVTVLGEIPNRERAIYELFHALKPGGLLSITEVLPDPDYQCRRTVTRLCTQAGFELESRHGTFLAFTLNFVKPNVCDSSAASSADGTSNSVATFTRRNDPTNTDPQDCSKQQALVAYSRTKAVRGSLIRAGGPGLRAFTLLELLVVISIIAILAGLTLPALTRAKRAAQRVECVNNLRQVALGLLMYVDDHGQLLPGRGPGPTGVRGWYTYKSLMKGYVGLSGLSSPHDRLFACPADTFFLGTNPGPFFLSTGLRKQQFTDYSSYGLNCGNLVTNPPFRYPGIGGERMTAIKEPSKTVLLCEMAAMIPFSWHEPRRRIPSHFPCSDARCVTSFVDGHVQYLRFYWERNHTNGVESWQYDPPPDYEYRWSPR